MTTAFLVTMALCAVASIVAAIQDRARSRRALRRRLLDS
jgi:hypothetical protein